MAPGGGGGEEEERGSISMTTLLVGLVIDNLIYSICLFTIKKYLKRKTYKLI